MSSSTLTAPRAAGPLIHLSTDFIRAKEYFEAIIASTSDAICTTDTEGRLIYFSPGAEAMLGVRMADVIGRFAHHLYQGGKQDARKLMKNLHGTGSIKDHQMVFKAAGGRLLHVSMSASLLKDRAGRVIGTMGISKDITSRVELENQLRALSNKDTLTGLYNQRYLHERMAQEASRARRQRSKLSMILMDLDGFKAVNDTLGHLEGDRILKEFASAIESSIRSEVDSAYRYGGDEFVVLLPGVGAVKAEKAAKRIVAAANARIKDSRVGCSYGTAALPPSGSLREFIKQADRRMFVMKAAGAGRKPSRSASSALAQGVPPR